MNDQRVSKINAAGKIHSPTAIALAAGLALACWGSAALANKYADDFPQIHTPINALTAPPPTGGDKIPTANDPIPGVDIIVEKNPPGHSIAVSAPTGSDGTYKLNGLEPGNYDLSIAGQRVQTIAVGANKTISGVLSRQPDGTASITFNGRVGSVLVGLPGAPISTSRSNKKAGIKSDIPQSDEVLPGAPINTSRSNKKAGIKSGKPRSDEVLPGAPVNTTRSNKKAGIKSDKPRSDEVLPGAPVTVSVNTAEFSTAAPLKGGDVNPSITHQGAAGGLSSHRTASPPKGGDGNAPCVDDCNSALQEVSTTRGTAPRPPKDGGKTPGLAGTPISGTPVGLDHDPGGERISTTTTDEHGAFHFANLPAGKYKLTLPGQSARSVRVDADGIAGGNVMRGSDGRMSIFDRWGNLVAAPKAGEEKSGIDGQKSDDNPVGKFGNGMNGSPSMSPAGMGGPMSPPGAGPMSPPGAGPMSHGGL